MVALPRVPHCGGFFDKKRSPKGGTLSGDAMLLENGMSATFAVVGGCAIASAVVVVEDDMLTFVTNDI